MSITRGTLACSQESTIHSTSFGHLATRDAEKSPRSKPNLKTSSDIRLTRYPSCLGKSSKGNPRARRSNYGLRQRHFAGPTLRRGTPWARDESKLLASIPQALRGLQLVEKARCSAPVPDHIRALVKVSPSAALHN